MIPPLHREHVLEAIANAIETVRAGKYILQLPPKDGAKKLCGQRKHFHIFPEFFYQLGGSTTFTCLSGSFKLEVGQLCIIPSHTYHHEVAHGGDTFLNLVGMLGEGVSFHFAKAKNRTPTGCGSAFPTTLPPVQASRYLKDIVQWYHTPQSTELTQGLLLSFLGLAKIGLLTPPETKGSPKVCQALHILNSEFYDQNIGVAQIAQRLECNADYLSQIFSKEMGTTVNKYLTRIRMDFARDLLIRENLSISEVAWASGYRDPSYFIRIFKRSEGTSPHVYRSSIKSA